MSQITQRIDNLGRREATTLPAATTQRVFASLPGTAPSNRQAVSLTNCDTAADLYVALSPAGGSAPSLSATDTDLIVPAKSSRQLQIGGAIDVWIRSSSVGAISFTALELL